jgi:hypothetical protein
MEKWTHFYIQSLPKSYWNDSKGKNGINIQDKNNRKQERCNKALEDGKQTSVITNTVDLKRYSVHLQKGNPPGSQFQPQDPRKAQRPQKTQVLSTIKNRGSSIPSPHLLPARLVNFSQPCTAWTYFLWTSFNCTVPSPFAQILLPSPIQKERKKEKNPEAWAHKSQK